ncbi:hypothetical protein D3C76_1804680 [compost metagenome]
MAAESTLRVAASKLSLRVRVIWLVAPVLEPTWKVMVPAEPSIRFLPFRLVESAIRVSSSDI